MKKISIKIDEAGERIDKILAKHFPEYSRNYFLNLIKEDNVLVNKKSVKASYLVKESDEVEISFIEKDAEGDTRAENIELNIIYEDDNVIVVNKEPNMVVHPACGNKEGTLVNALLGYFPKIKDAVYEKGNLISEQRPGLVHRLDKDTSGVMIVAKNCRAMHSLTKQIQNRTVKKTYLALCFGWPKNEAGHLVNYLGRHKKNRKMIAEIGNEKGKEAISDYKVIKCFDDKWGKYSLVEFDIKTGRTHQIRVQAAGIGLPVLGDNFYGNKLSEKLSENLKIKRQLLHARTLKITLPNETKARTFEAPLPEDISRLVDW